MKNLMKNTLVLCGLLLAASMSFGQTFLTQTTLAAAVTTTSTTQVHLTSATGVTAAVTVLFIDQEALFVNSISGTYASVTRGYNGTQSGTHASAALVFVGPATAYAYQAPTGSCTRTQGALNGNVLYLPVIAYGVDGMLPTASDCVGGVWTTSFLQSSSNNTPLRTMAPDPGAVAYTGIDSSGTAGTNTSMFCIEADLKSTKLLTGIATLNGTGVANGNRLVVLYDSSGNLVANSAVAGVATATASVYQAIAFTTPYYAVPARYFACIQQSSSSDTVRMAVSGTQDNFLAGAITGQTFGTIPTKITAPTTFTTVTGPYSYLY